MDQNVGFAKEETLFTSFVIDDAGSFSGVVNLAAHGFADFNLDVDHAPVGGTDDLIVEVWVSGDGVNFDLWTDAQGSITLSDVAGRDYPPSITNCKWPFVKIRLRSAAAPTDHTVTLKLRKWKLTTMGAMLP